MTTAEPLLNTVADQRSVRSTSVASAGSITRDLEESSPLLSDEGLQVYANSEQAFISRRTNGEVVTSSHPKWAHLTWKTRLQVIAVILWKIVCLLVCLYFFIFGLGLMGTSFKLIGGRASGDLFGFVDNPIAGLMVGILATVLVQSSSTSTSIVVGLVGSGTDNSLSVEQAIPIIMGCNIGTSVTATLVAFIHANKPEEFAPAFSAATINFFFKWLVTAVLLPIEVLTDFLEFLSRKVMESVIGGSSATFESPINAAIEPFVDVFVKVNSTKLDEIAQNIPVEGSLMESGWFSHTKLSDVMAGAILITISLVVLIGALILLVKLLSRSLKGRASQWIKKALGMNSYISMGIGLAVTLVVQSSSITTSTLIPLAGIGVITLGQVYPLTLGANIGTTVTPLLAALSTDAVAALQIAIVHMFFSVFGMLIWYPIPFMRWVPMKLATLLGEACAERRWLAIVYTVSAFLVVPVLFLLLSIAGPIPLTIGGLLTLIGIGVSFMVCIVKKNTKSRFMKLFRCWCCKRKDANTIESYEKV